LIRLSDLEFHYPQGDFRLRVPTLEVAAGERVAVVGASGSGKTTLLELLAGIRTPSRGRVEVAGAAIGELGETARRALRIRRIGLVFQAFELIEHLTVSDNLLLPFRVNPALPALDDPEARLGLLANETGLAHRLGHYPAQLSQGERQRAAICRALMVRPSLILADEPTGNLDPDNKQKVLALLLEQVAGHGATLIMVTHDHDLLAPFDRVIDMREFHATVPA
jgi:putative ABC transport system ATP-binding protein